MTIFGEGIAIFQVDIEGDSQSMPILTSNYIFYLNLTIPHTSPSYIVVENKLRRT
jgi:hypothetical protein